jgi:mannitol/fructose-specific phosphotransferase system IIA component (Ntr-type)
VGVLAEAGEWTRFRRSVAARCREGSFVLEGSMPHAKAPGLELLHLAVGRSEEGIGGLPDPQARVHLVFLVAIGKEQGHYLRVASRLAWLVRTPFCGNNWGSASAEALYLVLQQF